MYYAFPVFIACSYTCDWKESVVNINKLYIAACDYQTTLLSIHEVTLYIFFRPALALKTTCAAPNSIACFGRKQAEQFFVLKIASVQSNIHSIFSIDTEKKH